MQRVPLVISVWDDGYGISVPKELQTTKGSISQVLQGFKVDGLGSGFDIYRVKGWDYSSLVKAYRYGVEKVRQTHIPAIFHIEELTQPQGHSTSGLMSDTSRRRGWSLKKLMTATARCANGY